MDKKIKILAIDDIKDNLISLNALINETIPYAVTITALSGAQGLELASSEDPDVILLDIVMPGMDGFDVCRRLKADKKLKNIPVVFITALQGDKENRIRALECGAEAFISKPIDETELKAQIRAMVKIKAANIETLDEKHQLSALVVKRTQELEQELAERNKVEKALQESEERFRSIFEKSPIGIEIYDRNGIQIALNKASCEIFGIYDESSKGFNLFEGTSLNEELKQKLHKGEAVTYQYSLDFDKIRELNQYHTTLTGKAEMEYIITPLKTVENEDLLGYLLQVQDITERKKAEKIQKVLYNISNAVVTTNDLEELIGIIGEELGILVDTTNFYIAFYDEASGMLASPYVKDEKDDLTSWPAAKSMTGRVVLQNKSVLVTPFERQEMVNAGLVELIGVPAACWLGVPLHIDGKVFGAFVVQSYVDPQAYSEKDVEMLEFVSDQISLSIQRKQAEHDLKAAKEKAQESDRLKSAFLANMSHEIRTPMNAIIGFSGMLADPEISAEDQLRFTEIIQSRSDDLMAIINDILEISRIESGNSIIVSGEVNLNRMLEEIEMVTNEKIQKVNKSHLSLHCEKPYPGHDFTFNSDPYIVKQVFSNLLENAIKYTLAGSIRFGYYPPENGMITCFVKDSGIGISHKNQAIIFEHFRQAETDDPHRFGGTGLGLAICKGSLASLGGEIWVESEPGKGSTFFFTLPFKHGPEKKSMVESHPVKQKTEIIYNWAGKKILLVEDELTNMEFLKILLGRTNAEFVTAFNGAELKGMYDKLDSFDLVLLDVRLPDASGWELAGEIKALRPNLPVIAQTAYSMSSDRQKSEEAGCDGYISKPIKKEQLLQMISGFFS
ncbi:MAG: response regulator [Bacteroidota bacterium]